MAFTRFALWLLTRTSAVGREALVGDLIEEIATAVLDSGCASSWSASTGWRSASAREAGAHHATPGCARPRHGPPRRRLHCVARQVVETG